MAKLNQFGLLVWKNFTIQRRKIFVTLLEIGIPCLLAVILVLVRRSVSATQFSEPTVWPGFSVDRIPVNLTKSSPTNPWKLAWTPSNTDTDALVASIAARLTLEHNGLGFASETEMVDFLMGTNGTENDVLAGLVFTSITGPDMSYKIRMPSLARGGGGRNVFGSESWQTDFMFPQNARVGPRTKDQAAGGKPSYWQQGFLALQQAVDRALIHFHNPTVNHTDINIQLKRHPYPPYMQDSFVEVIQRQFGFILVLSFVFLAQNVVKNVVHEKEKKLKESMKMMGLANYLHWTAWFLHYMVMSLITVALITICLCVPFSAGGKVVSNSDPSVIFFFLVTYCTSTIAFGFAISTLFNKANTAAAAGGILFFLSYIPYSIIQPRYQSLSLGVKLVCSLLPNVAMAMGGQVIGMFEGTGAGVQWSTLAQGASVDDNLSMLVVMIMLLVDTGLFIMFAWYVEAVWPGEYGLANPWYFPFMKSYWCGLPPVKLEVELGVDNFDELTEKEEMFEKYPVGVEPGIDVRGLRKVFKKSGSPTPLVAVKGTNLKFYQGQITALLGHNGAGKTTTMSMLTGFIPPTSGTAIVNGHDIRLDIAGVRQSLGLCPQHDVLFDQLTVMEHMTFFCKLKGYPSDQIEAECLRMLEAVGILQKKNTFSKQLSGGMKRKLSVAIALVADSKVVILDEPTSGMDPNARRQTWELLQKERRDRTMVLTTHYMDEADHLGDRIAIMAEGQVKCYGTGLFLKKKYGAGYHMVMVKQPECNVNEVTRAIQSHVEGACLESNIGADLSYVLPDDSSSRFEAMFTELEKNKAALGILSYGVSVTTMEEVFIRVGESADPDLSDRLTGQENGDSKNGQVGTEMENLTTEIGVEAIDTSSARPNQDDFLAGSQLFLQQLRGLLEKRILYTWRNRVFTIAQLAVPLVFTIIALVINVNNPHPDDSPAFELNITKYQLNNIVMGTEVSPSGDVSALATGYKGYLDAFGETTVEDINTIAAYQTNPDIEAYLASKGRESISIYGGRYLVGAKFETGATNPVDVTGYFQNQAYHTSAIALNAITNAVLRSESGNADTIATINHPLPRTPKEIIDDELTDTISGFSLSFNIVMGMAYLTSSFVLFLIKERTSKSKHCQFITGAKPAVFWLSTFIWDYVNYMIPVFCLIIVFAAFGIEAYTHDYRLGLLLLVFMVYGWAILPFTYLASFLFTLPASGVIWVTSFNLFTGVATVLTVEILLIPALDLADLARTLEWVFMMLLPNFGFGQAIKQMYSNHQYLELCKTDEILLFCQVGPQMDANFTFSCCPGNCAPNCFYFQEDYMSWEQGGIGRMLFFLALQGVLYFLILFAMESDIIHNLRFRLAKGGAKMGAQVREVSPNEVHPARSFASDLDVDKERERIAAGTVDDPLVLREVVKYYGDFLAVDRLSLGVAHGECFGLLGINGAGKTTTFKMLTGDEAITSGSASVCGYDVTKDPAKVRKRIGYCPQYDALAEHMTGRELLTLYARLRGIRNDVIPAVVKQLLFSLTLEIHADKRCAVYSGGNKRKLSTALALMGEPYIVFLDEPSSGMDPVARRLLWDALCRYRQRGKTLVLTSHSMEECAALCTRMGIMVNGEFRCLGSQQHLKNKFGEGYTLMARVGYPPDSKEPNVKPLMDFILATFPDSELKDLHQNLLHYHIAGGGISWASIFGSIEAVKEKLCIEDYSISQTTLEQVFINFARAQEERSDEKKKKCCSKYCCCCCSKKEED